MAVLRVTSPAVLSALTIRRENRNPVEGSEVITCGFPFGLSLHEGKSVLSAFLRGRVSAVVPHPDVKPSEVIQYLLQMPVNPGNSGGPVVEAGTGRVIGVVSRRFAPKDLQTGLSIAEPIGHAIDVIKDFSK